MAYASKAGRARTSSTAPQAHAICDRCGFRYNHVDLQSQMDWAGAMMQNKRLLVCDTCYDTPQEQLRAIILPADPTPILNARVEPYVDDETDYATLAPKTTDPVTGIPIPGTTTMTTVGGLQMIMQPVGAPKGYVQNAQAPIVAAAPYNVALPLVAILANGTTIVTVTTSSAHGLSANAQVGVQGVLLSAAAGAYSITVTSSTQFTYTTDAAIPAGSLLTPKTRITTMNMGIPYNMSQIPQSGS